MDRTDVGDPTSLDVGRRQRKKQQTHENLMRNAARLFAKGGFADTTTEEIAEAADVSQRTFFRHFASKEAVLYGDQQRLRGLVRDAFEGRPHDEPILMAVTEAILALADSYEANRDLTLLQAKLAATDTSVSTYSRAVVQAEWERDLIELVSSRMGVDPAIDPTPEIMAGAAMSALRVALRRWHTAGGHDSLPDLVRETLTAIATLAELAGNGVTWTDARTTEGESPIPIAHGA